MWLRKTNRKNSNGCSLYEISVNEGEKNESIEWTIERQTMLQLFTGLWGRESQGNVTKYFFEDPWKIKYEMIYIIIF